jgi:hypothetical protein
VECALHNESQRATGFTAYGGADLGEVLATAHHIGEGDEATLITSSGRKDAATTNHEHP